MKANTYPIFEADQILTSGHLNDLVVYLEEQERLTRNKLIGIGIVCGLQLNYSAIGRRKEITISKGCGITSEGYLVVLDDTNCTHIREEAYVDPVDYPDLAGMKLIEMLTQEEASLEESEDVAPISTISEKTLQEKAVLLYLEKLDEDLKNCIPEDCNDKGKKRIFTVRRLLVDKAELRQLISRKQGFKTPQTETTLENAVNGPFHLPDVYIPRVVIPAVNGIQLSTLQGIYASSINAAIPQLAEGIGKTSELLQPALQNLQDEAITEASLLRLLVNLFEDIKKNDPTALQYFYSYMNDLAEAYHEFRDEAFDLLSMCCPDASMFGCHLLLGDVINSDDCQPSIYRHLWYPSPIHNSPNHLTEKVRCLYQRLLLLLRSFEMPNAETIEVTPSKSGMYALSERAIPYYYRVNGTTNLYNHWDYDKKRKCRAGTNLSYHASKYADPKSKTRYAGTLAPLNFSLAKNDFFRIEGHLGKNYQTAIQSIQQQRDQYGLAFDIVALKLGRVPDEPIIDQQCFFRDLDTQYQSLRQEMLCFLTKESNYFANIEYQPKAARSTNDDDNKTTGGFTYYKPLFNYTNYSAKYYTPTKSSSSGSVMKSSATGKSQQGTIGSIVTDSFVASGYTFNIQNLLTTFIGKYSFFANLPVGTLLLRIQYPLQMISLLEDAVVAIPDNLNELKFEDFEKTYKKLTDKAHEFKDKIIENLGNENFQQVGNEEDISDHLDRFIFDCNVTRFKVLFDEYQKRVKQIAQESLLSEYVKKHPGLEHTGGVPKGGTFVLIYHDQAYATPTPSRPSLSSGNIFTNAGRAAIFNKANAPSRGSIMAGNYGTKVTNYMTHHTGQETGAHTHAGAMMAATDSSSELSINTNFLLANQLTLDITRLVNKVVVGDLSLPYMCQSDCPSVTYVFPSVELSLSLPKNVFCKSDNDKTTYPFTASPEGGEVKGAGVEKDENGAFVFNPSAKDVSVGMHNFTYELDGKTTNLHVEIIAAPQAQFNLSTKSITRTENGLFLSLKNESENADDYLWEVNGETSTDKDLVRFFISNPGETLNVKLTATNKACFDTEVQTLQVAVEPLVFDTESGETSFCAQNQESISLVTKPTGGTVTSKTKIHVGQKGNQYFIIPAASEQGLHQLTYKDPDGRNATLQILISQPNADFTITPTDADGMLIIMQLIPVDRTCDQYTWMDGKNELHKTAKLPDPGPTVSVDFSKENRKTFTLNVDKGNCTNTFAITTDIKTLLSQIGRRGNDNGNRKTVTPGTTVSVGRGSNTLVIDHTGRSSTMVTKMLTQELGMTSIAARKALTTLPLTLTGISNTSLKKIEGSFSKAAVKYRLGSTKSK
jgi:hypothetical protein